MATERDADERGQLLIWGLHEVVEALETGHPVARIYFALEAGGALVERIKELARRHRVRFDFVDVGKLGHLAGTREHQDVVARISPVQYRDLDELLQRATLEQRLTVVALDQVQNSRNVGLIVRTAAGAGAAAILLPTRGGKLVDEEVARASAGAVFRVWIVPSPNVAKDLARLKGHGFWIYGLEAGAEQEVFAVEWPARRVLVVGNETKGLRPLVRKTADAVVSIPLAGGMDSLNVAVALGVALFDIVRQERQTGRREGDVQEQQTVRGEGDAEDR
jgi:23S rRNA (guanosine2251-2'-O)-methyltransferase